MSHIDLEKGTHRRDGSDISSRETNVCFSEVDEGSCYSQFYSTAGGSYDDYSFADREIDGGASDSRRVPNCSVEAKIEGRVAEIKETQQLSCSCKHDLAAAHKLYAEAWFKNRGN
ncbi:hypothetical protein Golax_002416, partial [Gossypium laxum]|nr:hypothetical protein [Gossypium laxum]